MVYHDITCCQCPVGFEGDRCETNIDDCLGHHCQNNATCVDLVDKYSCTCQSAFTGAHCETKVQFCKSYNPCENEARCIDLDTDYKCHCRPGFSGKNCSTNIDECESHICQNGAGCRDGTNSYKCVCRYGYTGRYCEIAPFALPHYPQASVCEHHDCQNGAVCYQHNSTVDYVCRCPPGFGGKKCEKLISISFQPDAYVSLRSLDTSASCNITIVMSTKSTQGVILYQGFDQHIAVEIFRGRVRVSFDIGNYPVSTMFSYMTVNDGALHTLELLMKGKNLTMRIDGGTARTIVNEGEKKKLESTEPLHLGGVPTNVKDSAFKKWHIRNTQSFKGCFQQVFVNGRPTDFSSTTVQFKVVPGCEQHQVRGDNPYLHDTQPCNSHPCKYGRCHPIGENNYKCKCRRGFSGRTCEIAPTCDRVEFRKVYVDPTSGCKTRKKVKHRRCEGSCGANYCCEAKKIKTRRVRLFCPDGRNFMTRMPIIRKCRCKTCETPTE
ncbi:Protein slit [Lamellibrachia satsuma]|nr:Protein slit [Lamellibrachia satsuma]